MHQALRLSLLKRRPLSDSTSSRSDSIVSPRSRTNSSKVFEITTSIHTANIHQIHRREVELSIFEINLKSITRMITTNTPTIFQYSIEINLRMIHGRLFRRMFFQYSIEINRRVCFCLGFLKLFLAVARFSWERVSTSNSHDACLFPRYALEIELLFSRNFNPHGNGLFPR